MSSEVHPHSPIPAQFRVKHAHRDFVAGRFGVMYAFSNLGWRRDEEGKARYAPVSLSPGDVPVFSWPAIEMRWEWLERVEAAHISSDNVWERRLA